MYKAIFSSDGVKYEVDLDTLIPPAESFRQSAISFGNENGGMLQAEGQGMIGVCLALANLLERVERLEKKR